MYRIEPLRARTPRRGILAEVPGKREDFRGPAGCPGAERRPAGRSTRRIRSTSAAIYGIMRQSGWLSPEDTRLVPIAPHLATHARRGWIVVGATFVTLILLYGVWYAYAVFLVALLKEFGWSRSLVAGAFSSLLLVHGACGPPVGWLLRRFGPRRVIIAGGLVTAVGLCLTAQTTAWWHLYLGLGGIVGIGVSLGGWIPAVVLARGWFPHQVGTTVGIAASGIGIGIFAVVPLAQLLIDLWGWRWAYRILAFLVVAWVVPGAFWIIRDPPVIPIGPGDPRTAKHSVASAAWALGSAWRTPRFWMLGGVYFSGNFVTQMLLIHQVAYLVDHGMAPLLAASIGGLTGLVSIGGKIGWGVLSDKRTCELAYGLAFILVAASLGILVLAGQQPASLLPYLYALLIGLGYGAMAPILPAAASDLFGGPGFSTIFGVLYTLGSLGLAGGTWSAGWIFDTTGSYAAALWLSLGMAILSPVLLILAAPRRPNPPSDRACP
jgi:MFS family permease